MLIKQKIEQRLFFISYLVLGVRKRLINYIKYEIKEAKRISTIEWWNRERIKLRDKISRTNRVRKSTRTFNRM